MYIPLTNPSDSLPESEFRESSLPEMGHFCQHSVRKPGKLRTIQQYSSDTVDKVSVCYYILY